MTAVTKPEPSRTQVARANLPPEIQAKIDENRARNVMVAQIRGTQWAKDCSHDVIRSVAEYAHRNGIDPVAELEILGGRIYKTAAYYERRGAELLQAGLATRIETDHVEADARLALRYDEARQFAADATKDGDEEQAAFWRTEAFNARKEQARRANERIRWNAPEKAAAVVVTRIYLAGTAEPIEGCNWCGNGVRPRDPVGDAEPSKTAETRSARRAWKKLTTSDVALRDSRLAAIARAEGRIGEEGAALSEIITDERAAITAGHEAARPHKLVTAGLDDPYATETDDAEAAQDAEPEGEPAPAGELLPREAGTRPRARTGMEPGHVEA